MYDIFLSYATKDRERVQPLFEALTKQGWTVFWDHLSIRVGKNWSVELEQAINASRCVVVAWSEHSIKSEYVREEANFAKRRGVLLPICLDKVEPPFGFTLRQATDFSQWNQKADHPAFIRLATEIYALLNTGQTSPPFVLVLVPKAKLRWPLYAGVSLVALAAAGGYQFLPKLDQALEQRQAELLNHEPSAKTESITDQPKLSGSQLPYGIEMVDIVPAGQTGKFMMGCDPQHDEVEGGCQDHEKPLHPVTLQPYQLSKTEVTVGQFRAFVDATGRKSGADQCSWDNFTSRKENNQPAVCISWDDAQDYIKWLNEMVKPTTPFRLPTEAEWEYAARSNGDTAYSWGSTIGESRANCVYKACQDLYEEASPVGSFSANLFGLHDMHGNVWEWVQDWYVDYDKVITTDNPQGAKSRDAKIVRGGSWVSEASDLRSSARSSRHPSDPLGNVGFRIASGQ